MLLGLYINSSNDTFSPCSHWPCLDPKAETVPTGPANGSIWLPEQFLCLVFWGQAGETLNASQVWKGLAAMLEGITSAPFAPHAPHPRSPPLPVQQQQVRAIPAMGQPDPPPSGFPRNAGAAPSLCSAMLPAAAPAFPCRYEGSL